MMKPNRYASGARPPALPTIVVVKRKAAMAGAMCVTFCMIAPVKPDGTRPKLGLGHPDLVGCLYEVIGTGHGSPPVS